MNTNSATRSCSRSTPDTVVLNCLWILNGLVSPLPVSPFVPRPLTTLPLAANRRAKSPESVVTILHPPLVTSRSRKPIDAFVALGSPKGRKVVADTTPDDWEGCGQLQGTFQPSSMYIPKMSAQYNMALGFDENGEPKRARFGLIGSSDGHQGRPGSSYKETNRVLYTDHKDVGGMGARRVCS